MKKYYSIQGANLEELKKTLPGCEIVELDSAEVERGLKLLEMNIDELKELVNEWELQGILNLFKNKT
jgi:hypothetical protein